MTQCKLKYNMKLKLQIQQVLWKYKTVNPLRHLQLWAPTHEDEGSQNPQLIVFVDNCDLLVTVVLILRKNMQHNVTSNKQYINKYIYQSCTRFLVVPLLVDWKLFQFCYFGVGLTNNVTECRFSGAAFHHELNQEVTLADTLLTSVVSW